MNITAGYKAYNGHIFTQAQADQYNSYTADIERATYPATIEILKDQRHKAFCQIIGLQGF